MSEDGQDVFVDAIVERIQREVATAVAGVEHGFAAQLQITSQRIGELERDLRELRPKP